MSTAKDLASGVITSALLVDCPAGLGINKAEINYWFYIMLDAYLKISFILIMSMSVVIIFAFVPLLLIQHFIHKKIFDPIYFNKQHYSSYELSIFNSFPLLLVKTIGYIKAIVFPGTMRRKFTKNILDFRERPFIYLLALISILILVFSLLVIVNTGIVGALIYFDKGDGFI